MGAAGEFAISLGPQTSKRSRCQLPDASTMISTLLHRLQETWPAECNNDDDVSVVLR